MTRSVHFSAKALSPALSKTAAAGFVLSLIAAGIAALAGLGSRSGWWEFTTALLMLRVAVIGGLLSFAVSLAGSVITRPETRRGGFRLSVLGLAISFIVASVPLSWYAVARQVPPIHDITTDTADPPAFREILPLRAKAPNPADYGGSEVAALQHAAYPDVKPLTLFTPPARAFDRALAVARSMGWKIIEKDRQEGRIEAVDRTICFGFTDDIVIRVRPENGGSRVDIRSVSRVGKSDIGTNAARIRKFLRKLSSA
jgi:uncharacterized protein (DUF1499 family)